MSSEPRFRSDFCTMDRPQGSAEEQPEAETLAGVDTVCEAHVESQVQHTEAMPEPLDTGQWVQKRLEVAEYQPFIMGPFEAGVVCEIDSAWYGLLGEPSRQRDVTDFVRDAWDSQAGIRMSPFGYNKHWGDPAWLRPKRLCVEYRLRRLTNVRPWDVSRGRYTEGASLVTLLPIVAVKACANVVGATVAAGGYAAGKLTTTARNAVSSEHREFADNPVFQAGFRAWLLANGIYPTVTYEPTGTGRCDEDMRQTPIIVSNHMCYLDGMVLAAIFGAPKIIATQGTLNTPLIGQFAEDIGVIEVDRADPVSRTKTMEAISSHVSSWSPGLRPLLLFPEGTTSNGDDILDFRRGAFMPGAPVRPVVLTYTGSWHPANVNFKTTKTGDLASTGDLEWCEQFLGHLMHTLQVKVLPPYNPSDAERADPQLYARNVRALMSEAYEQLRREADTRATTGPWQVVRRALSTTALWDMTGGRFWTSASDSQEHGCCDPAGVARSAATMDHARVRHTLPPADVRRETVAVVD